MWWVYMLRLNDGSYYTGITTDVNRRLNQHARGKGSKLVRSKLPFELAYTQEINHGRGVAQKFEYQLKKLTHNDKEELSKFYMFLTEEKESGNKIEAYEKIYGFESGSKP